MSEGSGAPEILQVKPDAISAPKPTGEKPPVKKGILEKLKSLNPREGLRFLAGQKTKEIDSEKAPGEQPETENVSEKTKQEVDSIQAVMLLRKYGDMIANLKDNPTLMIGLAAGGLGLLPQALGFDPEVAKAMSLISAGIAGGAMGYDAKLLSRIAGGSIDTKGTMMQQLLQKGVMLGDVVVSAGAFMALSSGVASISTPEVAVGLGFVDDVAVTGSAVARSVNNVLQNARGMESTGELTKTIQPVSNIPKGNYSVEIPTVPDSPMDILKNKLNGFFGKEQKKGEPIVAFDILYAAHNTAEDRSRLKGKLDESDIFIPEIPGWGSSDLSLFNDIAQGRKNPAFMDLPEDSSEKVFFESLYNSKKPVTFIDIPYYHSLMKRYEYGYESSLPLGRTFQEALDLQKQNERTFAQINNEREEHMLSNLKHEIERVLEKNPHLSRKAKDKGQVRVLLGLGRAHTKISHELKRDNQDVSRDFERMPVIFGYADELRRSYTFGKEPDDLLVARSLLEGLFENKFDETLTQVTNLTAKRDELDRAIISQFNLGEIQEIVESVQKNEDFSVLFEDKLKQKGITLPRSEEELDAYLANAKKNTFFG